MLIQVFEKTRIKVFHLTFVFNTERFFGWKMKKNNLQEVIIVGSPLLAGMFAEYLMMISDTVMVGRLGIQYLAAVAIGGLVAEILWSFAWTTAPAVQALVARRYGARNEFSNAFTGQVLNAGLLFSIAVGVIAVAISYVSNPVLKILIKDSVTLNYSMEYIRIIRWSIPISALYYTIYGFLSGTKHTKQVMFATVGMNTLNIILNYILIFGKFGFQAMGIRGAAWGTLIASTAGLTYFILLVGLSPAFKDYKLFSFRQIPSSLYSDIGRTWLPLSLQHIFVFTIFLVYESIISRFGAVHLAAIHIVFSIYWFGKTVVGGFAEGASILVGNSLGQRNTKEAVSFANAGIILGLTISLAIYLLSMFQPGLLVGVFNSEPETIEAGSKALRFFALFILIGCAGHSVEIIFTHNGWSKFVFGADIISNLGLTLGFTMVAFSFFNAPLRIIWSGYALYLVTFTAVLFGGFYSMKWTKLNVDSGLS